ncbi:FtsX-like permease family protein [Paraclostridium sordellii]|uniref:FtsX-like permease family protein n=1 Tax=Paraclostridium sordellii TaxID=1505 RepID=UPI000385D79A|nr:ABC transporter permease [Paeniclostridium sordellii]EPZ57791.1 ftsX-like permease family protein [[Clostridium] sordellii VPI 9048] [Paeniclostridium sordellii VPI 9048]CEK37636.1 ABC-type transport system, permease [[Clostridium] sordellii] [Paeniclostridium sordellii]
MSIFSIAFNNFKNNIKTYTMFFISMIFSVIILNNFIILLDGEALTILGETNVSYTKMILRMISLILGIFMFFFIWYTSNVFLRNRKKEIGLFTFMGVDLRTIGKIYFTEMMLIGLSSCVIGIGAGALFSKFFQMIVFAVANFNVDVKFEVTVNSILNTFLIFMSIFFIMSIKGFINIASSKVIDLLNDSKKIEKMPKINVFTYIIAIISIGLIAYGYYLVFSSKMNAVKTLVLVCIGTYGLFYAVIPIVLNSLINNKNILYKGENIITINSLAYRIKKNYTTYATIVILTACTITVLGTSVSMRKLYSMSEENDQLFSISFSSSNAINNEKISKEVTKVLGEKKFDLKTDVLMVKDNIQNGKQKYIVLPYDKFNSILKSNGYEKDLEKVNKEMVQGDKAIYIQRPGTLATLVKANKVTVGDKTFEISESDIRFKVLGSLINYPAVVVNNSQYEKLKNSGEMLNFYGIKIKDDKELLDKDILNKLGVGLKPYLRDDINFQIGIYKTQGVEWLKLTYAIGTFLFLVFILAEASIIYIKIYSDANDDKEKYKILKNIGVSKKDLGRAIRKEVSLFYILPLSIGLLHSFFAIQALGRFLSENLNLTFIISVLVSIGIFFVSAIISNKSFKSIVKV